MGIHWTELVVVAFVALLIFGPKRLPEIGGAVGRTYREFRKSLGGIKDSGPTYTTAGSSHRRIWSETRPVCAKLASRGAREDRHQLARAA